MENGDWDGKTCQVRRWLERRNGTVEASLDGNYGLVNQPTDGWLLIGERCEQVIPRNHHREASGHTGHWDGDTRKQMVLICAIVKDFDVAMWQFQKNQTPTKTRGGVALKFDLNTEPFFMSNTASFSKQPYCLLNGVSSTHDLPASYCMNHEKSPARANAAARLRLSNSRLT